MQKTLIVVDLQHDFYDSSGALYVKGGEKLPNIIKSIIPRFDSVIFTIDFHSIDHCSFIEQGGEWPMHCIEYTEGASIPTDLLKEVSCHYDIYRKGTYSNIEEYGAFGEHASDREYGIKFNIVSTYSDFVVCGIAGDYCVLETIKNLLKLVPKERVSVFLDGIVSIDGGEKLNNFIQENNLKIYKNDNN